MTSETNPNYAANRAWSMANSMVRAICSYLENPVHKDDLRSDLSGLITEANDVLDGLADVRHLLTSGQNAVPDVAVLDAIDRSIRFEVDAVIGTEIKKYRNPEGDKFTITRLLNVARSNA